MHPIPKTFSVRDLQRDYRAVIQAAQKDRNAVLLVNNSKPEAVVLDVATYNAMINDDYAWDMPYVKKQVVAAERSVRAGRVKRLRSWEELDR